MRKKRLVKAILEEYWGTDCAICGSTTPPKIVFNETISHLHIELSCQICGLTVSYNDHDKLTSCKMRDSFQGLEIKPKIANVFF